VRRAAGQRFHGHAHARYDHVHDASRLTAWGLFAFFSADPCVAAIPLFIAASPLGWTAMWSVALVYEAATIGTMILLVLPARAGARVFRFSWLDRYGDATAGGLITTVGLLVMGLGW
jgi:nickel/cobalt exporter